MYALLYETGTTGYYLGCDQFFDKAESRFLEMADKLMIHFAKENRNTELFFEMFGVFECSLFSLEYEVYKISTHKNQIVSPKLIFQLADFCLYVIELENSFAPNLLKRNQNHFYYAKSNHIEGSLELIMN